MLRFEVEGPQPEFLNLLHPKQHIVGELMQKQLRIQLSALKATRIGGGACALAVARAHALVGTFLTAVTEQLKGGGLRFGSRTRGRSPPRRQGMAAGVGGALSHTHGTEAVDAALRSLTFFFQSPGSQTPETSSSQGGSSPLS